MYICRERESWEASSARGMVVVSRQGDLRQFFPFFCLALFLNVIISHVFKKKKKELMCHRICSDPSVSPCVTSEYSTSLVPHSEVPHLVPSQRSSGTLSVQ